MKKEKKKGAQRYHISAEDFVRIWQSSSSITEVMKATNMPINAVYSRVNSYRAKDIVLKRMQRTANVLDVNKLNEIARTAAETAPPLKKKGA